MVFTHVIFFMQMFLTNITIIILMTARIAKKEFSSFQDKPERIVSVLTKYIYLEKYSADFSFYLLQN